jgi:hypothetical protein
MNKRNVATVLWFLMGWTIGSALAVIGGYPSIVGVAIGVPFAAIVRWDPSGRLWAAAPDPDVRRVLPRDPSDADPGLARPVAPPSTSVPAS